MKIVVLGAGVIGVTSAWELSRAGHEVTVVDRQPAAAMETSFANAGEISPGYSTPWAAPGIPQKALRWMFQRHAPLVLHAADAHAGDREDLTPAAQAVLRHAAALDIKLS
mgnify:CR=1 FL=1